MCPTIQNLTFINDKPICVSGDPVHLVKSQSTYLLKTQRTSELEADPEANPDDEENPDPDANPDLEQQPAPGHVLYMGKEFQEMFQLTTDEISIEPVEELVKFQEDLAPGDKLVKRLDAATLKKARDHFGKMNAGPHLAIFSMETSAAITQMVQHHNWPEKYMATASHIWIVARWFEICRARGFQNSANKSHPNELEEMKNFIRKFIKYICALRYYKNQKSLVTVQKGSVAACKSWLWLVDFLFNDPNVDFFAGGRALLCDIIENHHFWVRYGNKCPTMLQCLRKQKALMVTQALTHVGKGHNYAQDDRTKPLFDFATLDQLVKEETDEAALANADWQEWSQHCIDMNFDPRDFQNDVDFAQGNALARWLGYCLWKILQKVKCFCKKFYCEPKGTKSEDTLNTYLNTMEEWTKYKFIKPTSCCNTIFNIADQLFRENRGKNLSVEHMDDILREDISTRLKLKYPEIPTCQHFAKILKLFLKGKWHWYADQLYQHGHLLYGNEIDAAAAKASKSTASMVVEQLQ